MYNLLFGRSKGNKDGITTPNKSNPTPNTSSPEQASMQQTLGNQELSQLANEPDYTLEELQTIYQTRFFLPLEKEVALKFGVGRRAFSRSKELNAFRQKMKDAAREQASTDITNYIDSSSSNHNFTGISKTFYSLMANREAYTTSKTSVDSIMKSKSREVINNLITEDSVLNQLEQAALSSSSTNQLKDRETRKKKALSGAQAKATDLLERFRDPAINAARTIVKGDKAQEGSRPDTEQTNAMLSNVKQQVTSDKIGEKALVKVVEAESVNSGLKKIAPIIEHIVPDEGDSAELSFELKIPVAHGAFVKIGLGAEAENDGDQFKIGANISIGAGIGFSIAELSVSLGMFIEAQGSSITSALNLLSYGMYRNTNAGIPTIAQQLWGMGNKSGRSSQDEAEIWASTIEENELSNDDNYVDVGQSLTGAASVETGIYKGEFELAGSRYTKYNKQNIEALAKKNIRNLATGKIGGLTAAEFDNKTDEEKKAYSSMLFGDSTVITSEALAQKSKLLNELGTYKKIALSTSHELELGFCDLSFSADGAITFYEGRVDGIEASFSVDIPGEIEGFDAWSTILDEITPAFLSLNTKLQKAIKEKTPGTPQEQQEAIEQAQEDALEEKLEDQIDELTTMLSESSKSIDPETGEEEYIFEKDSGYSLNLDLEKSFEDGGDGDWSVEFTIQKSSSMKLNTPILTVEYEKSSKLMSIARKKEDGKKKTELNFYQNY